MKPLDFSTVEPDALKVNKLTTAELEAAPETKIVFEQFGNWVGQYNKSRNKSYSIGAPIICGYNIINFDFPIIKRYCEMFGFWDQKRQDQNLFNQIYTFDVLQLINWLMYSNSDLNSLKLTIVAEYLGFPTEVLEKAHNALEDVRMTTEILRKLIGLSKYLTERNDQGTSRLKIKGSLANLFNKD